MADILIVSQPLQIPCPIQGYFMSEGIESEVREWLNDDQFAQNDSRRKVLLHARRELRYLACGRQEQREQGTVMQSPKCVSEFIEYRPTFFGGLT